jgi:3-oxoacyl-[acyl-carrier protein] reductase
MDGPPSTDPWRLDGKAVVVTGAARGIGRAVAEGVLRAGGRAVLADRDVAALAEALATLGSEAAAGAAVDAATREGAEAATALAVERFGRLDGAVANAGIAASAPLLEMAEESWDEVLRVNLKGAFLCFQAAARRFEPGRGGSLVAIGSIAAQRGNPGRAAYVASKAALAGLVKASARELAPARVRVNLVAPGAVRTRLSQAARGGELSRYLAEIPLGRIGEPTEVAALVCFLLGDASAWITGQSLSANGGAHL